MKFNVHSNLEGLHALLSPSKYSWLNYDAEKLARYYRTSRAAEEGTKLHEFASNAIKLGIKLQNTKKTLNMFVNDAIGFRMESEQTLYFSEFCFGTADAISFRKNLLRIHDLKTGETPAHIEQLMIYAALFCLEYNVNPFEIDYELRIYQSNDIMICNPTGEEVKAVMDRIVEATKILQSIRAEEEV